MELILTLIVSISGIACFLTMVILLSGADEISKYIPITLFIIFLITVCPLILCIQNNKGKIITESIITNKYKKFIFTEPKLLIFKKQTYKSWSLKVDEILEIKVENTKE